MCRFFRNIKKYFKYAVRSARAELKSEVAESYLNWLWWVIEPFCFMLIYSFVFGEIFRNKTPYFASFIFIGLTVWEFFNRMISGSVTLITKNRDLVTKVYLPKYILLVSKSFTYLFKTGISLVISLGLMAYQHVTFSWHILFIFPILAVLYVMTFGFGTILMNLGVTINDLSNLTRIVLRMVFYLSGVFYDISVKLEGVGDGKLSYILLRFNPAAFIMHEMRKVMLENRLPSFEGLAFWLAIGLACSFLGVYMIHKNENSYAKVI